MRAPEKVLLSVRSAARDQAIRVALQHSSGEPLADRIVLCVHLLLEASKQHDSKWWPYLRSLPTEYNILGAFPAGLEQAFQVHHPSSFHVHACAASTPNGCRSVSSVRALPCSLQLCISSTTRSGIDDAKMAKRRPLCRCLMLSMHASTHRLGCRQTTTELRACWMQRACVGASRRDPHGGGPRGPSHRAPCISQATPSAASPRLPTCTTSARRPLRSPHRHRRAGMSRTPVCTAAAHDAVPGHSAPSFWRLWPGPIASPRPCARSQCIPAAAQHSCKRRRGRPGCARVARSSTATAQHMRLRPTNSTATTLSTTLSSSAASPLRHPPADEHHARAVQCCSALLVSHACKAARTHARVSATYDVRHVRSGIPGV